LKPTSSHRLAYTLDLQYTRSPSGLDKFVPFGLIKPFDSAVYLLNMSNVFSQTVPCTWGDVNEPTRGADGVSETYINIRLDLLV